MSVASKAPTGVLTASQMEDLSIWRALALDKMPYFAPLMYALRPMCAPGLGTFAVDAQLRLYIDFDATSGWSDALKAQVLLHECMHIFHDHAGQAKLFNIAPEDRSLWNVAGDAAINDDLRDAGCAEVASMGILPAKIGGVDYETTDYYFDLLKRDRSRAPEMGDDDGCGSVSGGNPVSVEVGGDGDAVPGATETEVARVRITAATQAKDYAASGRGTLPAGITVTIDDVLKPSEVPWRQVMGREVRGAMRATAGSQVETYSRRDARRHNERLLAPSGSGSRIVIPGAVDYHPVMAAVRDTSASMSDAELVEVTTELDAISRQLRVRGKDFTVLDVDTKVAAIRRYTGRGSVREVSGRGGTNMCAGIEAALKLKPRPTVIVVITDGETGWPAVQPSRKVKFIACIVGPRAAAAARDVPSWMRTVVVGGKR